MIAEVINLSFDISFVKFIFFLIFAVVIVGILVWAIFSAKRKTRDISRKMFGTDSLIDGVNKQREMLSETPRSLHAMTSVYLPQITRDFPEFDYEHYKNKAKSVLRSYFTALHTKKASALTEEHTLALENYVQGIISDLNTRNVSQIFNQAVIHDVQIARYIKTGATVTILFELAVGCYNYIEDENHNVVFGDKSLKTQSVYEIGLVYVQDADKVNANGDALGINCPNCGAPIKNLGTKFCNYCGTSVIEVNTRAWKFDSVREQTTQRRQY